MTDRTIYDFLPRVFPTHEGTVLGVVVANIQRAYDEASARIREAKEAGWLDTAEDEDLNAWGRGKYKTLGRRRGRGEEVYRRYLRALPTAYQGAGRAQDIRAAIGSGLLVDASPFDDGGAIELRGSPESLEYDVSLHDHAWATHPGGLVRELAEFADAAVVSLRDLEYLFGGVETEVRTARQVETVTSSGGIKVETALHVEHRYEGRFEGSHQLSGAGAFNAPDSSPSGTYGAGGYNRGEYDGGGGYDAGAYGEGGYNDDPSQGFGIEGFGDEEFGK